MEEGRLEQEVNSCKVMLLVIGPDWTTLPDDKGNKRLFKAEDVTRWEVETGLNRRQEEGILGHPRAGRWCKAARPGGPP